MGFSHHRRFLTRVDDDNHPLHVSLQIEGSFMFNHKLLLQTSSYKISSDDDLMGFKRKFDPNPPPQELGSSLNWKI